jgi:hypothetical protein
MADDGDDGGDNGPKTAKQLRFELSNLVKQETQHNRTIDELRTAHRTRAETIDSLTARIASVEEELGAGGGDGDAAGDVGLGGDNELVTYGQVAPQISTAFRRVARSCLADKSLWHGHMERRRQLTGFFARVHWENNAAEFKVLDTEEGTEVSFGALLQDVSRYFGVQDGAVALADKDGGIWPLEPMVHSELRALDTTEVWLVEKPFATEANETAMEFGYEDLNESEEQKKVRRRRRPRRSRRRRRRRRRVAARRAPARRRATACTPRARRPRTASCGSRCRARTRSARARRRRRPRGRR